MINLQIYIYLIIIVIIFIILIYIFFFKNSNSEKSINPINDNKTEPINTEPIHTEPIHTEPIHTEPINTEPIHTEPINTEPINTEPIHTEPINTEPTNTEPTNTEPINTEDIEIYIPPNSEKFQLSTKTWKQVCYVGWGMSLASGFIDFIKIAYNAGITHIILEDILLDDNTYNTLNFYDSVLAWTKYSNDEKIMLVEQMNNYNITLMVNMTIYIDTLINKNYKYSNSKTLAEDLISWMHINHIGAINLRIHYKNYFPTDYSEISEYSGSLSKYIKLLGQEKEKYICISHESIPLYYIGNNIIEKLYGEYIDFYNINYNGFYNYEDIFIKTYSVLQLINANKLNPSYVNIPDFKIVVGYYSFREQSSFNHHKLYSDDIQAETLNNIINENK